jgi:uncharacterized Zn-binding protein involved in type VI secretion
MKRALCLLVVAFAAIRPAHAQAPAVRVSDPTSHGGLVLGPGVPTVRIGGLPASVAGDQVLCPQSEVMPPVPHVGGPILAGSATVFIGGRPAARAGDQVLETGAIAILLPGAPTVVIGP